MSIKTVGILSPGEMGQNIAMVLGKHGLKLVTCLQGRSKNTQQRAEKAGIVDLPDLEELVLASDIILSVVVPASALEVGHNLAEAIAQKKRPVLFADANAISPMTAVAIGKIIEAAGGRFVDVSIIGSAKKLEMETIFYVSGQYAEEFAVLQDFGLQIKILGDQIGQASSFKIIYAGLTKGLSSLSVELLLTARAMGLLEQILEKWRITHPEIVRFMNNTLPGLPLRAARRSQEMEELSETIKHAGLEPIMATASGGVLRSIGNLGLGSRYSEQDESLWSLEEAIEILYQGLKTPRKNKNAKGQKIKGKFQISNSNIQINSKSQIPKFK